MATLRENPTEIANEDMFTSWCGCPNRSSEHKYVNHSKSPSIPLRGSGAAVLDRGTQDWSSSPLHSYSVFVHLLASEDLFTIPAGVQHQMSVVAASGAAFCDVPNV